MCELYLRVHLTFHELFFVFLLRKKLDVHATHGFFDHVPLFFHVLPFVLLFISEYLESLAPSLLRNFLKILFTT